MVEVFVMCQKLIFIQKRGRRIVAVIVIVVIGVRVEVTGLVD